MTDRPPISVIIPTRNRPEMLAECLAALRACIAAADELVVADSASSDGRTAQVAETFGATYVRCDEPGASRARNAGWRQARYDAVVFVDDDVRVWEGWAEAMAKAVAAFPDAAFISGKIGSPPDDPPEFAQALMLEPDAMWIEASTPVPIGHTASLLVPRAVLLELGGFDEELGAGARFHAAEDQDFFDRVFQSGRRGRYEPAAFAVHEAWRSRGEILSLEWSYGVGSGARMAKLLREDRHRVAKVWRENVVYAAEGVIHAVKVRYKFLFVMMSARLLGTIVGVARGLLRPLHNGHYRA